MIVTSNSVTHNTTIKSLIKVGQVDSNLDVVSAAVVSVASTLGYSETFTSQTVIGINSVGIVSTGITTTTFDRLEEKETQQTITFNTSGIAATSFVGFSSLTESKVLSWISSDTLAGIRTANETALLDIKDKKLNPLKYEVGPAKLPWS